jgi:hypothetical protein
MATAKLQPFAMGFEVLGPAILITVVNVVLFLALFSGIARR